MRIAVAALGFLLLATIVADAIQTVVVARHARKVPLITRLLSQFTWVPFAGIGRLFRSESRRENYLGLYGPLSLLMLLGFWAISLIVAFAILQWSAEADLNLPRLVRSLYLSAGTFFTLGSSEPQHTLSKLLMVIEAGFGFTFLGLVIGYLPVLYQSYSSRELRILFLDARAGSPPSAAEFLTRVGRNPEKLAERLAQWEEWSLDLLQCHLSYPMLAYYRSQHANQSWLGALTTIVDVSALVMLGSSDDLKQQAEFTFAAGRHALVHTASIFHLQPDSIPEPRLKGEDFSRLCDAISNARSPLRADQISKPELQKLMSTYEPYARALSSYFLMALPPCMPDAPTLPNWQVRVWGS